MKKSFRQRRKNNAIYNGFIIYFTVILLLMFIFGITLYCRAKGIMETTVYGYNEALIDGVVSNADLQQRRIDELITAIYENDSVTDMLKSDVYTEEKAKAAMYTLQKYGGDYCVDINLYSETLDTMISQNDILSSEDFFKNGSLRICDYDYETWKNEFLSGVQYKKYFPPITMKIGNQERKVVYYGHSYYEDSIENVKGRVYILIDAEKMLKKIQKGKDIPIGDLFVLDQNRNVIMSTGGEEEELRKTLKNMGGSTHGIVESTDGSNVCVYERSKAGLNSWTYLFLIRKADFLGELYRFRNRIIILILFFMALAVVFAVMRAQKAYAPIKQALNKITDGVYAEEEKCFNEIELIMKRLDCLKRENVELDLLSYEQARLGKSIFTQRILRNKISSEECKRLMKAFGISFLYDDFCVLVVKPENYGVFTDENGGKELLAVGVTNILEEMIENAGLGKCYDSAEDKLIAVLINFNDDEKDYFEEKLNAVLELFCETIERELGVDVSIGVSDFASGTEAVPTCYENALVTVEFDSSAEVYRINFFERLKCDLAKKKLYYYPQEMEKRMINYLCRGERENVSETLDEILSVNSKIGIGDKMKVKLCHALEGTMFRAVGMLSVGADAIDGLFPENEHLSGMTMLDIFAAIKERCLKICDVVETEELLKPKQNELFRDFEKYINENYMNYDMCVSSVADKFGVTRQNVFNLFKQNLGIKPSDYIQNVRMEKAKELLSESKMTNSQIASAVGFTSDVSFVRVFKKVEGITPKKYRDMRQS